MTTIPVGILCVAVLAQGQAEPAGEKPGGLYGTLAGMGVLQMDSDLASVGGVPLNATLEFDMGYGVQAGVGYTYAGESPWSLSLELEYAFRTAQLDLLSAPPLTLPAAGTQATHSIMLNALGSVDIIEGFGLYGGLGVGMAITQSDLVLDLGGGMMLTFPADEDLTFCWQVVGGVQYAIGRHVMLFGGLKYFDAGEVGFNAFGGKNRSLGVEAGLRVYF